MIWYFVEDITIFFIFFLSLSFPILNRGRTYKNLIKNYRYSDDKEIDSIVTDLNLYFKGEATRGRKTIKSIIEKIEEIKIKSQRFVKIDKIHGYLFVIIIYFYVLYSLLLTIGLNNRPSSFELYPIPFFYEIGACLTNYFLIFFGSRKSDLRNLQRGVTSLKSTMKISVMK